LFFEIKYHFFFILPCKINPLSRKIGIIDAGILNSLLRHFKYNARSYVIATI